MKILRLLIVVTLSLLFSCKKDILPIVETVSADLVDATHVVFAGNVLDEGSSEVTTCGFCLAQHSSPNLEDQVSLNSSGHGMFMDAFEILPDSTYYVRAYATSSIGTSFGKELTFCTSGLFSGVFIDPRDGNSYKWVTIGMQTWMAENLAYLPAVSPPNEGGYQEPFYYVQGYVGNTVSIAVKEENYKNFGVLYNWKAVQTACPSGWRMSSDNDWMILEEYLGMKTSEIEASDFRTSGEVGKKVKSKSDWFENGNGSNSSGLNVRPGGSRNANGLFGGIGTWAIFRTSTAGGSTFNFSRGLGHDNNGIIRGTANHSLGLSTRCIKY